VNSGSHFLVRLAKTHPFRENEIGTAVVLANGSDYLRAVIVPASDHSVDHDVVLGSA
jgi:hypothetical protein